MYSSLITHSFTQQALVTLVLFWFLELFPPQDLCTCYSFRLIDSRLKLSWQAGSYHSGLCSDITSPGHPIQIQCPPCPSPVTICHVTVLVSSKNSLLCETVLFIHFVCLVIFCPLSRRKDLCHQRPRLSHSTLFPMDLCKYLSVWYLCEYLHAHRSLELYSIAAPPVSQNLEYARYIENA